MLLKNKKAVIFGVANKKSIAWGIAKSYSDKGANITLVCQNERMKQKVAPLALEINADLLMADVTNENEVQEVFKSCGQIDILVHSIAYAPTESISKNLSEINKDDFLKTMEISAYSLITLVREAKKYLNKDASIITLSYLGASRIMTGYNLMGIAKSALENIVRYLSVELGSEGIRINAISAGPLKTLSSSVFPSFNKALELVASLSPMKKNIELEDVGNMAVFLASDLSKMITGEIHFVDGGAHIMGA